MFLYAKGFIRFFYRKEETMRLSFLKTLALVTAASLCLGVSGLALAQQPATPEPRVLKMQSAWPAGGTLQENFKFFAERVDKLTGGALKIETMAGGQVVPPFEVLDAISKKVLDGGQGVAYYWQGKNSAATLFSSTPAGPFGMDHMDFLGWMHEGGGMEMYWDFYQNTIKMNVVAFPVMPPSPQAFGWFKRPIKDLKDFKGMKCRQTGIVAEIFQRMGMSTVNMPGGEIAAAAQRGVIDCAEWVSPIEDLKLGLPQIYKYYYTPGMHETSVVAEFIINADVWKSLPAQQQEAIRSAATETYVRWWVKWQKQNADALDEMRTKYGTQILRTPPEILTAFLKAWDEIAAEESAKNPVFKKVYDSQRAWASKVVPAKRYIAPPYSFAANHYWPQEEAKKAKPAAPVKP
jgi:TRAP-type mannitol/chloroaromatic compound transport system substrate-binding protein